MKVAKKFPLFSGIGLVAHLLAGKKPPKPEAPPAPLTRDDAREAADRQAALARRRGGAADIVTGVLGAEPAGPGGKTSLGS